jgi:hypothetical protein
MELGQLSEIILYAYNSGRLKSTNKNFSKQDIFQMAKMSFGNSIRELFYANKKLNEGDEYYFTSPLLEVKRFKLSDLLYDKYKRIEMGNIDFFRLPKNSHFTNFYPSGCGDNNIEITQVQPAEENYYLSSDFDKYVFCVAKGNGLNFYHLPSCITHIDLEATYDSEESTIVPLDICFDIANQVLGITLRVPGFGNKVVDNAYSPEQLQFKQKMASQETPE